MRNGDVPATIRRMDAGWQIGAVAFSVVGTVIAAVSATGSGTVRSDLSAGLHGVAGVVAAVAATVVLGAWLGAAAYANRRHPADRRGVVFGVAIAIWIGQLVVSDAFVWVAFALFIGAFAVCRPGYAVALVVPMATAAVVAPALHGVSLTPGRIAGPTIGAVTACAIALVLTRLAGENERRRALVAEVARTRDELAAAERAAGVADERERLAREIHDTLAQGFSSIVLLLEAADGRLATTPADVDAARAHLRQAATTARLNLSEARRFVRALAPPDATGGPLASALARLEPNVVNGTSGAPAEMHVHVDGTPVPLPMPVEVTLLRLAQAALANVAAHAGATRADVTLSYLDGEVALDVVDDGCGFDPAATGRRPDGSGFGLPSMTARVAALGGTLTIESAPGDGTAIAARIPLQPGDPAGDPAGDSAGDSAGGDAAETMPGHAPGPAAAPGAATTGTGGAHEVPA